MGLALQPTATTLELTACQARGIHAEHYVAPNSIWVALAELLLTISQPVLRIPGRRSKLVASLQCAIHTLEVPQIADCGALCRQSLVAPPFWSTPLHKWCVGSRQPNDLVFHPHTRPTPDLFVKCWQAQMSTRLVNYPTRSLPGKLTARGYCLGPFGNLPCPPSLGRICSLGKRTYTSPSISGHRLASC